MKAPITNTLIRTTQPTDKPFEVRDTVLKGLLLRIQPSGSKTYYVEYGRGKRVRIGRADALTPVQAREEAKVILADSFRGEEPEAAKRRRQTYTFGEYLEQDYFPWAKEHIRSYETTKQRMGHSFQSLMPLKLNEISAFHVEKWRSQRLKDGVTRSTINRELTDLKSCLNKAVTKGLLSEHPLKNVAKYKKDKHADVDKHIERYLSVEEEANLRAELDKREARIRDGRASGNEWRRERGYELKPESLKATFADHLKPMILLSLNTGVRQGELFSLEWEDINLEQAYLKIQAGNAKSGKVRHVPLNSEAMSTLLAWKAQVVTAKGLVFKNRDGKRFDNVRKSWDKLLLDAQIQNFRWHDMRHHFASMLVMSGVDLNTVRELLGHTDYKMTLRYAHLAPENKLAAVQRLNKR